MARPVLPAFLIPLACACALTFVPWPPGGRLAAQTPDAAAHKAWMNDASDEQENYRFAVADKDTKAAAEALVKIESLMAQTEAYWVARKAADGVRLARDTRAHASQAAAAVKAGNMAAAAESFDRLSAACNACHDLHLEKR